MIACKVVGYSDYSFSSDKGELVEGRKYHLVIESENTRHNGYEVAAVSVSSLALDRWRRDKCLIPSVGTVCTPVYNRYGRVAEFMPLTDTAELFTDI